MKSSILLWSVFLLFAINNMTAQMNEVEPSLLIEKENSTDSTTALVKKNYELYAKYRLYAMPNPARPFFPEGSIVFKDYEPTYEIGVNWSVYEWEKRKTNYGKQLLIALPFAIIAGSQISDFDREGWRQKKLTEPPSNFDYKFVGDN